MNSQVFDDKTNNSSGEVISEEQEIELGILLELGSIGAGHAATALSDVIQQPILIDVPRIHTVETQLIPRFYDKHDTPTMGVYLQLKHTYGCDLLLMLELEEAKKIAAMMTCASSIEEVDPSMEASAILELANILIGSFLTAISDFVEISLLPTTPQSAIDTFDAIIDSFLVKQSMVSEKALIFETRFKRMGEDAKCMLMIFPSQELKNLLTEKSKSMIEEGACQK